MYTADSIRETEFSKAGMSGVKADEVYTFVDDVAADFETLTRQKDELIAKLKVLADCIEEYRRSEDTVKTAILTAQKTADAILSDAEARASAVLEEKTALAENLEKTASETAEQIMNETQTKSREMLDEATMRANRIVAEAEEIAEKKKNEIDKLINQQMFTYNYIKDEVKNFKEHIMSSYKEHLEKLSAAPMLSRPLEVYNEQETEKAKREQKAESSAAEPLTVSADDAADESAETPKQETAEE